MHVIHDTYTAVWPTSKMDQLLQLATDEYKDKASILCYTKQLHDYHFHAYYTSTIRKIRIQVTIFVRMGLWILTSAFVAYSKSVDTGGFRCQSPRREGLRTQTHKHIPGLRTCHTLRELMYLMIM